MNDFQVVFMDEAYQAGDLETLLAWAYNTRTLLLFVLIDDPVQLHPTFKSNNYREGITNSLYDQGITSLFERLWRRGFPTYVLTEQHRLAKGLKDIFQ